MPPAAQKQVLLLLGGLSYHTEIILGFAAVSQQNGWNLAKVAFSRPGRIDETAWDGILIHASESPWREWAQSLSRPVVNVSRKSEKPGIPTVSVDNYAVGVLAAEHFLAKGLISFAFLGYPSLYFSDARQAGFTERLARHGLSVHLLQQSAFCSDPHISRRRGMGISSHTFLRSVAKPVAVFAATDELAYALSMFCTNNGISVPNEIVILGCNNERIFCHLGFPPRSSVDLAPHAVGRECAHLLGRLMDGEAKADQLIEIPPTEVVQRLSTDTLAVDDPHLNRALHFLKENLADPLTVNDLARHAGVSRRLLETACRRYFQQTPLQLIHDMRFQRARSLLVHTHLSMNQIAQECGLTTGEYFSQLFRKKFGQTPSAYRRKFGET